MEEVIKTLKVLKVNAQLYSKERSAIQTSINILKRVDGIIGNDITPELVEEHFPKGKCQERGKAIVLHATMLIALIKYLKGE